MPGTGRKTVRYGYAANPSRRRRRRRKGGSRRRGRRLHRRYGRRSSYRKNPGGMLIDLAKRAAPVLVGLFLARVATNKLGPRVPGISKLGQFQGPAVAIGTILLTHVLTKKVGKLAKYREKLMLGAGLNALEVLFQAFAPASVKAAIGMGDVYDRALGDYVRMGEYLHTGPDGAPIDDNLGDYVAVGDVEEELGDVEEELGVDEELGDSAGEGVSTTDLLKPVPTVDMLAPVPTRSFVRAVPKASEAFDNPSKLYRGIFANNC